MSRNKVLEVLPVPPGAPPQSPPEQGKRLPEPLHEAEEEEGDFGDEADLPLER